LSGPTRLTTPQPQQATPDMAGPAASPRTQREAPRDIGNQARLRSWSRTAGQGEPLPPSTRRRMESLIGQPFGAVRVHADAETGRFAGDVGAAAFAVGDRIGFAPGRYHPQSPDGQWLIAHELAHTAQQRAGGPPPLFDPDAPHEREAHRVADAVVAGRAAPALRHATAPGLALQPVGGGSGAGGGDKTPAHAGGTMGELDAAFALGQMGFDIIIGPAGPGGHQLTAPGLDIVADHPVMDEVWVLDNKASGGTSTVRSASAITTNLETNINDALAAVRAMPAFPRQQAVISKLQGAATALARGGTLPPDVRIAVTNAGGYHSDVSGVLERQGVDFIDITGEAVRTARQQDVANARAQGVRPGRPVSRPQSPAPAPAAPGADPDQEGAAPPAGGPAPETESEGRAAPRPSGGPAEGEIEAPLPSLGGGIESSEGGGEPGGGGGPSFGGAMGAGAVAAVGSIATIFINRYLAEHFAGYKQAAEREITQDTLAKARPEIVAAIDARGAEIRAAQAKGLKVYLHTRVLMHEVDSTDHETGIGGIGYVPYSAELVDIQILIEGETLRPYDTSTSLAGDLVRGMFSMDRRYQTSEELLPGTDLDTRRIGEVTKVVDATMSRLPGGFEGMVLRARLGGLSQAMLHDYAKGKQLAAAEALKAKADLQGEREAAYWTRMEALIDAPIGEVVGQAKVKLVPLDAIRQHAVEKAAQGGPEAAYWTEIIQAIDAPLDDSLLAEQQREVWRQGPTKDEVSAQSGKVAALQKQIDDLQGQVAALSKQDARTPTERASNEPPHPPWSKINPLTEQLKSLRKDLSLEKQLLRDDETSKRKN
jgi:hypothetical protein